MLDIADVKYRSIILTLASSGIRREALTQITKDEDDLQYVPEHKLYKVRIYRRTKFEQVCFTSPEAADAINLHLEMNKDDGHKQLFYFKTPKDLDPICMRSKIRWLMILMELFRKYFISNLLLAFPCLFGFSSYIHLEFHLVSYQVRSMFEQGNAIGRSPPLLLESDQI
jgi:hypothetical protein